MIDELEIKLQGAEQVVGLTANVTQDFKMKQYLSIESIKEFILSKSESLEIMIKAHYGLSSSPTPQTFEQFFKNVILPKTKESEPLGIWDLSTVLEDLAKNARSCEMKNACALLYVFIKFNKPPKRNENKKKHFEPRKTGEKRVFKPRAKKEEVDESSSQEEK